MRSPTRRATKRKALPPLIVEMRWQDGRWSWCDVRPASGPHFAPLTAHERALGYVRVKYAPVPPRAKGAKR